MSAMEDSKKGEGKPPRKPDVRAAEGAATEVPAAVETAPPAVSAAEPATSQPLPPPTARSLRAQAHVDEATLADALFGGGHEVAFQPLNIVLRNVRANSRVLITIRDDQRAAWSEGDGRGLVGLSFSTSVDPALYLSNFLINTREFFVQTYADSQEILVQLYVRTTQRDLRGRVDLPPNAVATLQSLTDRTSLVGLSAFAIDF
jgi:hypothetical protein